MINRICLVLLLRLFVPGTYGYGQFETAEIFGTVRDASGALIPGASVTLTNVDTGIESTTVTDEIGNYDFFSVKVGRYSIEVEAAGFSKASLADISANVNARQRVDVTLQVGLVSESVEVVDTPTILETDSSEHG